MAGVALEEAREAWLAHLQLPGDHRQAQIPGQFTHQVVERLVDTLGAACVQGRRIARAGQGLDLRRRGVVEGVEQLQEQDQALQAVGAADVFHQLGRLHSSLAAERQAAPGLFEQRLQIAEFRQGLAQGEEGGAVELQHHIAAGQVLTGGQVADPVVGQVRADQRDMPGTECADVVARHQLAAALANQVDLEFGVVIPAR